MALAKHQAGVKRFSARYGKRVRERLAKIESISKSIYKCPYCNYQSVKRVSNGIFSCSKCNAKFTGRAYAPAKKKSAKAILESEVTFEDELFVRKEKELSEDEMVAQEARKSIKQLERGNEEPEEEQPSLEDDYLESDEDEPSDEAPIEDEKKPKQGEE